MLRFRGYGPRDATDSGYGTAVLGPTLLIAAGIGLTFPTLMSTATADAPEGDAGIVGGLASTATQVGESVSLAVLATVADTTAARGTGQSSHVAALAAAYSLVFLVAAGVSLTIAIGCVLLPHHHRAVANDERPVQRPERS